MAIIYRAGAEFGSAEAELGVVKSGTVNIDNTVVRSGRYSFKASAIGGHLRCAWTYVSGVWTYHRIPFFVDRRPSGDVYIMSLYSGGTIMGHVVYRNDGKLKATSVLGGNPLSAVVELNKWSVLEVACRSDGATQDVIYRLNGVEWFSLSATTAFSADQIRIGKLSGLAVPVWYDDLGGNDSTGADNNTWLPLSGGILHSLPVVDISIGANWLNGNGGVLNNAWDILNALPPQGINDALTGSNPLTQIRNATLSGAQPAAGLDLEYQSYDEAGLPDGATISSICPLAILGDNHSSQSAIADISLLSNPVISSASITSPAGTASTYPSGWSTRSGLRVLMPTPDLETRPIMRIVRTSTTGATRLLICHAAIQIEYAPVSEKPRTQIVSSIWA